MLYDSKVRNELSANRVKRFLESYAVDMKTTVEEDCVESLISDFVSDLGHYARSKGVSISDVIVKAIRNLAEEISVGDAWLSETELLSDVEKPIQAIFARAESESQCNDDSLNLM